VWRYGKIIIFQRLDVEKSLAEPFKKEAQLHQQEIVELQLKVSCLQPDTENLKDT